MADGQADDVGFDLLQQAQVAIGPIERDAGAVRQRRRLRLPVQRLGVIIVGALAVGRLGRDVREIRGRQRIAFAQHGRAEERVLELADIAGPPEAHQHRQRIVGDRQMAHPRLLGDPAEEMAGERRKVADPVAKRRDRHVNDVEPVIEILPEPAGGHFVGEPSIGGGDDPHVHGLRDPAAEALELAGLEHAQQLYLRVERKIADLVEEEGRAVGILEPADMAIERAGEGALFVPEQHRFDEIGGDRAAIHRVQGLLATGRGGMDRLGDDFLARPALPFDQDGDARPRRLGRNRERRAESGGRTDDLLEAEGLGDLFRKRAQFAGSLAAVGGGIQCGEQPIGRQRLDQEIGGSGPHRLDRGGDAGLRGEDEKRQDGIERAHLANQCLALRPGQPVIEQDRVEIGLLRILDHRARRLDVVRAAHPPARARADRGDQPPLGGLIVDEQQATCRIGPHVFPSCVSREGLSPIG